MEQLLNLQVPGNHGRPLLTDVLYVPDGKQKPVIIFAHGFKGYKDWGTFPAVAASLAGDGFVVIKFNFAFNGGTPEQPIDFPDLEAFGQNNYSKEQKDLRTIIGWSQTMEIPDKEVNREQVYLVGHSRGGGAVLLTAGYDKRVKKVVSWAAVADFGERFQAYPMDQWKKDGVITIRNGRTLQDMPLYYQFYEDFKANEEVLTISSAVKQIQVPQLIVHGESDEAVSVTDAQRISSWNPNAELLIIPQTGHTFDGKHPWDAMELPPPLELVVKATSSFLKE